MCIRDRQSAEGAALYPGAADLLQYRDGRDVYKRQVQDMVAWLLEAFCIVAVNVYMMISGYFLCESSFKLSRLLTLWVQLWLYSVGIGVLAAVTGIVPAAEVSTHYYLTLLFPVTMGHY